MKSATLPEFLTDDQISLASTIYVQELERGANPEPRITKEVIEPNLEEINRKLGQENDARYLSYVCIYVLGELDKVTRS